MTELSPPPHQLGWEIEQAPVQIKPGSTLAAVAKLWSVLRESGLSLRARGRPYLTAEADIRAAGRLHPEVLASKAEA